MRPASEEHSDAVLDLKELQPEGNCVRGSPEFLAWESAKQQSSCALSRNTSLADTAAVGDVGSEWVSGFL
eukprot:1882284-Amphidinium_carterae.1